MVTARAMATKPTARKKKTSLSRNSRMDGRDAALVFDMRSRDRDEQRAFRQPVHNGAGVQVPHGAAVLRLGPADKVEPAPHDVTELLSDSGGRTTKAFLRGRALS